MTQKIKLIVSVFILLAQFQLSGQPILDDKRINIIPLPKSVKTQDGVYKLPQAITISASSVAELEVAELIKSWLKGYEKEITIQKDSNSDIVLSSSENSIKNSEGYSLSVNTHGIKIMASNGAGLFYGFQSLAQLLPLGKGAATIPLVEIQDEPAFGWRGSMLDVSRHFFPVSFIKKYIDFLSAYKINTFHWHLTDDQGWRIEIKKYPKLTQVSAFRKETLIGEEQLIKKSGSAYIYDGTEHGGFYTQEEIKEIVAYAQKRYVTIVPEIEMPGHTLSVLAAYPELACKSGNYEVFTKWGVSHDIICPTEASFRFFENVLSEVVQLFPGKYVHIGGDEAPKTVWKESPEVQKIMKKNKITEVEKVQGWFNARIEKFLISKGKKLIGWDEILEGGITPASTVMSWRGETGGIEAATHGNDVVMAPHSYLYLDYGQNKQEHSPYEPIMICCYLPMEKVYNYNPIPKQLSADKQKHILGVQANLWTEYMPTTNKVEYALFPRLFALAEIAWTPAEMKDYQGFVKRVGQQYSRLDQKGIHYRIPEPEGLDSINVKRDGNKVIINLTSTVPGSKIYYTIDGHLPDETTFEYNKSLILPADRDIKVRAITIAPNGRKSAPVELVLSNKATSESLMSK